MRKYYIVTIAALVVGLAIAAFADNSNNNANSFAEGFAKGFQQSYYGTRQQDVGPSLQQREIQEEQIELLRQQLLLQQRQLQEQEESERWYNNEFRKRP